MLRSKKSLSLTVVESLTRQAGAEDCGVQVFHDLDLDLLAGKWEWIDLFRVDKGGRLYARLVDRAVHYLPMPKKTSKLEVGGLAALAALSEPGTAEAVVQATDASRRERVRADAERFPSRILANALVNAAWRSGPVESIHAGRAQGYPVWQRRVTAAEERTLMRFAGSGLALGMTVCLRLAMERPPRPWAEQVLPYGLASMMLVTPSGWTLTGTSREVRLP